ncbi:hypothetical protein H6G89_22905 [Oscillatoria sp. FACHB-1407]|uniref:hypothetical protein n=1 Tax=Oscillatoria sp. FACHB-1407 TaxID=2692847 RepID=UPI0016848C62|nr:hypothetical protein [Oscillatoria sp. FACHB-1407]MBD2463855.1 hypothetical protein [Oscillatoria sp. FACHB-1407]
MNLIGYVIHSLALWFDPAGNGVRTIDPESPSSAAIAVATFDGAEASQKALAESVFELLPLS